MSVLVRTRPDPDARSAERSEGDRESVERRLRSRRAGGTPIDRSTRRWMEPRFDADFGSVRFHTDPSAWSMADTLGAQAFTYGEHVYFGRDRYDPASARGRHLIAHELTHVVQQRRGAGDEIRRKPTENPPLTSTMFGGWKIFQEINADDGTVLQSKKGKWIGPHVQVLQNALLELHYSLPKHGADGKFGGETARAIRNFQIDSGFKGKDIDGVVGHKTLRALDRAFSTRSRYRIGSSGRGGSTFMLFKIPVTSKDTPRADFLRTGLQFVFDITPTEANTLVENGWDIKKIVDGKIVPDPGFELTEADEDREFHPMLVRRSEWESIRGDLKKKAGRGKSARPEVEEKIYDLKDTGDLYRLTKAIAAKERERNILLGVGVVTGAVGVSTAATAFKVRLLEAEIAALKAKRDKELARLKITLDAFTKKGKAFQEAFGRFAAETALDMLEDNATQARIEKARYGKIAGVEEVRVHMAALAAKYDAADALWWQGLSYAETRDPNKIKTDADLLRHGGYIPSPGLSPAIWLSLRKKAYDRYRLKKRGGNSYFEKCYDAEHDAHAYLSRHARKYPMLAYPGLELRKSAGTYAKLSATDLQAKLLRIITHADDGILAKIEQTKAALKSDYTRVWSLPPVIASAKRRMGILDGTVEAGLVADAVKDYEDRKFWRDIGLAALGIGLGLLALVSGPVGWAALAGGITVGAIDAYIQYEEISFKRGAADTALDPARALSDVKPGWFWFALSLATLGLDVFAAVKIVRTVVKTSKALKSADDLVKATQEALEAERRILEEAAAKATGEELARLTKEAEAVKGAKKMAESAEFAEKAKILARVADDAVVMERLGSALADPDLVKSFTKLDALLDEGTLKAALRTYGGTAQAWITELPEVLEIISKAKIAAPDLLREIFTDPRVQKVMLDNAASPDTIVDAWTKWGKYRAKGATKLSTFGEYLGTGLKYSTKLDKKPAETLIGKFGKSFVTLDFAAKNRKVLRETAGKLVDALNEGRLPKKIHDALEELLQTDLIGKTTNLKTARGKVVKAVNQAVADNIESMADYKKIMDLIEQGGSRGAIGEMFAAAEDLVPGLKTASKASVELEKTTLAVFKGRTRIIIDRFLNKISAIVEIKVGSSFDIDQLALYKRLYENQVELLKELKAAGITGGIDKIIYQVMPGPGKGAVVKAIDPEKHALRIWNKMKELGMDAYSEVRYLKRNGELWKITEKGSELVKTVD